jgi:hypothetical protein
MRVYGVMLNGRERHKQQLNPGLAFIKKGWRKPRQKTFEVAERSSVLFSERSRAEEVFSEFVRF